MESEGSVSRSQELANEPYPEPGESSPQHETKLKIHFNIIL